MLANAIVFKGTWDQPFDPNATHTSAFHVAGVGEVETPLMHATLPIATARIPGGRLGMLPFRGRDVAMLLLLPDAPDGLPALEAQLSGLAIPPTATTICSSRTRSTMR